MRVYKVIIRAQKDKYYLTNTVHVETESITEVMGIAMVAMDETLGNRGWKYTLESVLLLEGDV